MVRNNRKGQAALEFLTTYGWAFLVILVMIGALAYFGVLDPSRFVSERCMIASPFSCDGGNYRLVSNMVSVKMKNSLNEPFYINSINFSNSVTTTSTQCTSTTYHPSSQVVPIDGYIEFNCTMSGSLTTGEKERVKLKLFYNQGSSAVPNFRKVVEGEVYANVQ